MVIKDTRNSGNNQDFLTVDPVFEEEGYIAHCNNVIHEQVFLSIQRY